MQAKEEERQRQEAAEKEAKLEKRREEKRLQQIVSGRLCYQLSHKSVTDFRYDCVMESSLIPAMSKLLRKKI